MSRPLRIQYPGALYYITARGNGGQKIYRTKLDYQNFLKELEIIIKEYNWISYAYCLMPNHYHLFIKTIDANLSRGMRQLNGNYTQRYNINHKTYGSLFQGRFKAILVEDAGYQGNLVRYITLNPVKAKMVKSPLDWTWNSYGETMGLKENTGCVHVDRVLKFFDEDKTIARKEYEKFLYEKVDGKKTWNDLRAGLILGSANFAKEIIEKNKNKATNENTKKERYVDRPTLNIFFKNKNSLNKKERNSLIYKSYIDYGYSFSEIGREVDLHYSSVSKIIRQKQKK